MLHTHRARHNRSGRAGAHGAYAMAIAEMVREPGLDIDTMFARIRLRTNEATQGAQTPWEVSQLQQVAMLVPGQAAPPPSGAPQGLIQAPQAQIGAPVVRHRAPPRPIQEFGPEDAYAYAVEPDDLPTYPNMCASIRTAPYSPRVWAMIRARREALLWREALLVNSPDAYWTYLERYPDGLYVFDARRRRGGSQRRNARRAAGAGWSLRMSRHRLPANPPGSSRFSRRAAAAPLACAAAGLHRRAATAGCGRHGLGRRPQSSFPVIVTPPPGQRPGFQGRPPGVGAVTPPGASRHAARMEGAAARPSQGSQPAACRRASGTSAGISGTAAGPTRL